MFTRQLALVKLLIRDFNIFTSLVPATIFIAKIVKNFVTCKL